MIILTYDGYAVSGITDRQLPKNLIQFKKNGTTIEIWDRRDTTLLLSITQGGSWSWQGINSSDISAVWDDIKDNVFVEGDVDGGSSPSGDFLPLDGNTPGATTTQQEFTRGVQSTDDPDDPGQRSSLDNSGVRHVNLDLGTRAEFNNDGSVGSYDDENSTNAKLLPDGGVRQTSSVQTGVFSVADIRTAKIILAADAVNNGNLTPILLLIAPGAGKINRIVDVVGVTIAGDTPYDASKGFIYSEGVSDTGHNYQLKLTDLFNSSDDTILQALVNAKDDYTDANARLVENAATMLQLDSDSSSGNSIITLYIFYITITL